MQQFLYEWDEADSVTLLVLAQVPVPGVIPRVILLLQKTDVSDLYGQIHKDIVLF